MKKPFLLLFGVFMFYVSVAQDNAQVEEDTITFKNLELDEITIRSPKYNGNVFSLPASVTMVSGRNLENFQVRSLSDASGVIPNFFMPDYGSKLTSPVYIRGIGNRINTPSVGLYVDNIPYFEKSVFNFDFFDIERIEVLRGPQGTLYGRNTMGGLINIFTSDPGDKRETSLLLTTGNYNQLNSSLMHNQPLGKNLSMIANLNQLHRGGFYENSLTGRSVDQMDSYSGRLKFLYTPDSKLSIQMSLQFESSDQGGYPYALYNKETQSAGDIHYDHESLYNRDLLSAGLHTEYRTRGLKISGMTSFQHMQDEQEIDQDFTEKPLYTVWQDQNQNMIAQEISVQNDGNKNYNWIVGAFGFSQWLEKQVDVNYLPAARITAKSYNNSSSGLALFHQSTYRIGKLSITGGIRFDGEKSTLDYLHYQNIASSSTLKEDVESELTFFEIIPRIALQYGESGSFTPYLSIAKGYNSGGFNSTFEREEDRSFDPENSWNYEAGIKMKWLDQRIYSNLTFFLIDWKNQQIYQPVPSGQGSMLTNAGRSESKGIEMDMKAFPVENLETWVTFGLNDAHFIKYFNKVDFSGNMLPYVPAFTLSGGGNYSIPVNKKWLEKINLNLVYQGLGKHYWHEDNSAWQEYYGILNSRINFTISHFELGLWGKNLTKTDYHSFYFTALGNSYAQIGKPATMGLNLKFTF